MRQFLSILVAGLVLTLPLASARDTIIDSDGDDADGEEQPQNDQSGPQLPSGPAVPQSPSSSQLLQRDVPEYQVAAAPAAATPPQNAMSAKEAAKQAAEKATKAAKVANKVATHSVKIIGNSKKALKHALGALHDARVESAGLAKDQKDSLKKAEAHLREATKTANYVKLQKLQQNLDKTKASGTEREQMRRETEELRKKLREKNVDDKDIDKGLNDLDADLERNNGTVTDESKAELERLRQSVDSMEPEPQPVQQLNATQGENVVIESDGQSKPSPDAEAEEEAVTPVQEKGLDIDTQMPYGDLEPFGREDTAQELTENSISESDEMVDQLERAEVAEEKRAVFRALTRLRGAAITSFDGVARLQTGNIDEYNKVHQWRSTHPLHHLADEESDVSKWAFPDNAD